MWEGLVSNWVGKKVVWVGLLNGVSRVRLRCVVFRVGLWSGVCRAGLWNTYLNSVMFMAWEWQWRPVTVRRNAARVGVWGEL